VAGRSGGSTRGTEQGAQGGAEPAGPAQQAQKVRLDRWLCAARFFKTRSLATDAVGGGHVHIADGRAKPSRPVSVGDRLTITRGSVEWTVIVRGVSDRRGPAGEAALLYEETDESRAARERAAEHRRAERAGGVAGALGHGRPTKRDRRRLDRLRRPR
jgi:ribosome-associated heat shock protein Hsp15